MDSLFEHNANEFFVAATKSLDISDAQYEAAERRYKAIGEWLGREDSSLAQYTPEIFPQGSFLLGTVIKPTSDEDEFDIDLVCKIATSKAKNSQESLKKAVGDEIMEYVKANNFNKPAKEGKRCWTLEYAESAKFHMDVLPAIPDSDAMRATLESYGVTEEDVSESAIAITDNTLPNYAYVNPNWPVSNPQGYAEWFRKRMEVRFKVGLEHLAEQLRADVADVPQYKVKTPLQMAIQLLKRHRDIMFADDLDHKPISIIITTLAARAYENEESLVKTLQVLTGRMGSFIEDRSGVAWVENPVNPAENFADKWAANPRLKRNFLNWLTQIKIDFSDALIDGNIYILMEGLRSKIGNAPTVVGFESIEPSPSGVAAKVLGGLAVLHEQMSKLPLSKYLVPHRKPFEWKPLLTHSVNVQGEIKSGGLWVSFSSLNGKLPKFHSLRFYAETNLEGPYQVYWQIVNTGDEAKRAECLRGEIKMSPTAGRGGLELTEQTAYTGMHWVECFIVKNGILRARSGPYEVSVE